MGPLLVFFLIALSCIAALFLAWFFYQQARNRERIMLIEKGENLGDIFQIQHQNKFTFVFPWLKLGVVVTGMSVAFLLIAFFVLWFDNDDELVRGFIITSILGFCLGGSFIANHFLGRKKEVKQ